MSWGWDHAHQQIPPSLVGLLGEGESADRQEKVRKPDDWIGARSLANVAATTLAAFYGISILASLDAFSYQKRLEAELSQPSGRVVMEACAFCVHRADRTFGNY
jgi:hypothetical protein